MKKMKNVFMLFVVLLMPNYVFAKFYVVMDSGLASLEIKSHTDVDSEMFNANLYRESTDFWAAGGGFKFTDYITVELLYGESESIEDKYYNIYSIETEEIKLTATEVSLIGNLPYNNNFNIYGRIGLARIKFIRENNLFEYSNRFKEITSTTSEEIVLGLGARYYIGYGIGSRIEYRKYGAQENQTLSSLTVGLEYGF